MDAQRALISGGGGLVVDRWLEFSLTYPSSRKESVLAVVLL